MKPSAQGVLRRPQGMGCVVRKHKEAGKPGTFLGSSVSPLAPELPQLEQPAGTLVMLTTSQDTPVTLGSQPASCAKQGLMAPCGFHCVQSAVRVREGLNHQVVRDTIIKLNPQRWSETWDTGHTWGPCRLSMGLQLAVLPHVQLLVPTSRSQSGAFIGGEELLFHTK